MWVGGWVGGWDGVGWGIYLKVGVGGWVGVWVWCGCDVMWQRVGVCWGASCYLVAYQAQKLGVR